MASKTNAKKPVKKSAKPEKKEVKKVLKSITKKEFISDVVEDTELTAKQVERVLESIYDLVVDEARNSIIIPGIVKISLKDRAARIGRNPKTGEKLKIPAKKVVKAKLLKGIKEEILKRKK